MGRGGLIMGKGVCVCDEGAKGYCVCVCGWGWGGLRLI